MDFSLTDEQAMVRETARSLFEQQCPLALVRAAWDDPSVGTVLWEKYLSGWMELADGDVVDVMLFLEEYGRAAVPSVLFASLLAAQVAAAGGKGLSESATVAIAGPDGLWVPHPDPVKHFVASASQVQTLVVVGGSAEAPTLAVIPSADVHCREVDQMDRLRPVYRVELPADLAAAPLDPRALRHATERALVACSAELIGVGRWLLDSSVSYAKERVQFDRPIGSFQGLQWELVDAALQLERAAAAVAHAAMCVDADDPDRHRAVHGAKAEAGLAARVCARTGMQVHGGIGYTFEHGLHFWLRRAYAGDAFMGPSSYHHDRLAALLFGD